MKRNRFLSVVTLILAMSFVFGACDSGSSSKKDKKKKTKITEEVDDDDEDKRTPKYFSPDKNDVVEETIPSETSENLVIDNVVDDDKVIHLWSYTDELPWIADEFKRSHPDFEYDFEYTIVATANGAYVDALTSALELKYDTPPDIFCAEEAFVNEFINEDGSAYVNTYENLGIDVDNMIKDAEIAQYIVDVGTRESDGKVVGLSYQSTSSVLIYRASIAEDAFGTSEPEEIAEIFGAGTNSWDDFLAASDVLEKKGYSAVSAVDELWVPVQYSAPDRWCNQGVFTVSPEREAYIDLAMEMYSSGYTNCNRQWTSDWYYDMAGKGDREVFCFIGPSWFINYTISYNADKTFGDWKICEAPVSSYFGGSWVVPSIYTSDCSDEKKEAIAEFLTWVTLDSSDEGLQYLWATGKINGGIPDTVASNAVMKNVEEPLEFLGGQNLFDAFIITNEKTTGKNSSAYDDEIKVIWLDVISQYLDDEIKRDVLVEYFAELVCDECYVTYSG